MHTIATTVFLLSYFLVNSANAQWSKIANLEEPYPIGDSIAEYPTCIYFIDLPGPARIGFAGTNGGIWKTSDGGSNWHKVPVHGNGFIEKICFKDSLTGWFVAWEGGNTAGSSLFRTSDGGDTWLQVPVAGTMDDALTISYDSGLNRLFLAVDSLILVSSDLGSSWKTAISLDSGITLTGFSFSTDSIGYAAAIRAGVGYSIPSVVYILRTFDGGLSWQTIKPEPDFYTFCPLAIPGTPICFAGCAYYIWRSDDYGQTWSVLAYPDSVESTPLNPIQGNLSRLYVQTIHGMLLSTDGGYSWQNDGGPSYDLEGMTYSFYCGKGITVAGMTYTDNMDNELGNGLWEETWPQAAGVAEPPDIIDSPSASPNPVSTGTIISFGISKEAYVKIEVFDILGNRVSSAGFESLFEPGNKAVPLSLQGLPSGIYFARIVTAYGEVQTVKLVKE